MKCGRREGGKASLRGGGGGVEMLKDMAGLMEAKEGQRRGKMEEHGEFKTITSKHKMDGDPVDGEKTAETSHRV